MAKIEKDDYSLVRVPDWCEELAEIMPERNNGKQPLVLCDDWLWLAEAMLRRREILTLLRGFLIKSRQESEGEILRFDDSGDDSESGDTDNPFHMLFSPGYNQSTGFDLSMHIPRSFGSPFSAMFGIGNFCYKDDSFSGDGLCRGFLDCDDDGGDLADGVRELDKSESSGHGLLRDVMNAALSSSGEYRSKMENLTSKQPLECTRHENYDEMREEMQGHPNRNIYQPIGLYAKWCFNLIALLKRCVVLVDIGHDGWDIKNFVRKYSHDADGSGEAVYRRWNGKESVLVPVPINIDNHDSFEEESGNGNYLYKFSQYESVQTVNEWGQYGSSLNETIKRRETVTTKERELLMFTSNYNDNKWDDVLRYNPRTYGRIFDWAEIETYVVASISYSFVKQYKYIGDNEVETGQEVVVVKAKGVVSSTDDGESVVRLDCNALYKAFEEIRDKYCPEVSSSDTYEWTRTSVPWDGGSSFTSYIERDFTVINACLMFDVRFNDDICCEPMKDDEE